MINKLRKKFILYSTLSIFALLTVILSVVNVINFSLVTADADNVTQQIADRGGAFNGDQQGQGGQGGQGGGVTLNAPPAMGPDSPETESATRYFTYSFDSYGNATKVDYRIASFSEEETLAWATSIHNSNNSTGWSRIYYRYRQYNKDGKDFVTVIDYGEPLLPSYR
ncbi:MAG: hypothetical protein K6F07_03050, partial [Bacilli bacterium]|nr:hypothetical protein [Bacilli bacterium]